MLSYMCVDLTYFTTQHLATKDSNVRKLSTKYQHLGLLKHIVIPKISKNFNCSVILGKKKKKKQSEIIGSVVLRLYKEHGVRKRTYLSRQMCLFYKYSWD